MQQVSSRQSQEEAPQPYFKGLAAKVIKFFNGFVNRTQQIEQSRDTISDDQRLLQNYYLEFQENSGKNIIESQTLLESQIELFSEESRIIIILLSILEQWAVKFQEDDQKNITETQIKLQSFILNQTISSKQVLTIIQQYQNLSAQCIREYNLKFEQTIQKRFIQCRKKITQEQAALLTQTLECHEEFRTTNIQQKTLLNIQLEICSLESGSIINEQQEIQQSQIQNSADMSESLTQIKYHINKCQEESFKNVKEQQYQLTIKIQAEYEKCKNSITESQIQLGKQVNQQFETNQQTINSSHSKLQQKCQQLQIECMKNITQTQNQLQKAIVSFQTECKKDPLHSQPLLEAQIKKCKIVCQNNIDEQQKLIDQIAQLGQNELRENITQSQGLLEQLIQIKAEGSRNNINEFQTLLQQLLYQCHGECMKNIQEQQIYLKSWIQQCQEEGEIDVQLQVPLQKQIQECQIESIEVIIKSQNLLLEQIEQCLEEYKNYTLELQNLLQTQIRKCFEEMVLNLIRQLERIIQQFQDKSKKQIKQSQTLVAKQISNCKQSLSTFTEQAIKFQTKIEPPSLAVSPETIKKEQIKLEAEQPHLVLTKSEHFSDKNQLAALTSKLNDQIEDYIQDLKLNNQIEDPAKYSVPQRIDADNPEVLFHVLKESFQRQNKTLLTSKKSSKLNLIGLQGLFAGGTENSSESKVTLQETPNLTFDLINSNQNLEKQFKEDFASSIAKDLNVNQDQVKILRIERGSIKVIYQVIDNGGGAHSGSNLQELEKKFPGTKPALKIHEYFQQACLNVDDFDPRYNMHWESEGSAPRGPTNNSLTYYFPNGWKGYALKVTGIYGANDNWLAMNQNPDEWYVLFHGTHQQFVQQIMNQRLVGGLLNKPGSRQAYASSTCLRTEKPVGEGVYFSNHVEVCEDEDDDYGYTSAIQIGNKQFKVVFQSRVCPINLKQVEKRGDKQGKPNQAEWDNDYFVVNQSCDIRPYRILLKEIKKN